MLGTKPCGSGTSLAKPVRQRSLCQSSTSSPGSGKVSGLTVRVGRVPPLVSVHGPSPPQHTVPRGRSRGGRGVGPGGPRRFSLKPDCEPWQPVFGAGTWPGPSRRGGPGGDPSAGSTTDASWDPACFRLRPPRHRRGSCSSEKYVLTAAIATHACRTDGGTPGRSAGAGRTAGSAHGAEAQTSDGFLCGQHGCPCPGVRAADFSRGHGATSGAGPGQCPGRRWSSGAGLVV